LGRRTEKPGVLVGLPGSGKTTVAGAFLRSTLQGADFTRLGSKQILFCAPTNRAVRVGLNALEKHGVTTIKGVTLARLLNLREYTDAEGKQTFKRDGKREPRLDPAVRLLVIDEASMIGEELLEWLKQLLRSASQPVHVLFIGDDNQLPPVNEPCSPVFQLPETDAERWELTEVMRHRGRILQAAVRVMLEPNGRPTFSDLDDGESLIVTPTRQQFYRRFREEIANDGEHGGGVQLLAWRNKTVNKAARIARSTLYGSDVRRIVEGELLITTNPVYGSGLPGDDTILASTSSLLRVESCHVEEVCLDMDCSRKLLAYVVQAHDIDADKYIKFHVVHEDNLQPFRDELTRLAASINSVRDPDLKRQLWREDFYPFKRWDAPVASAAAMTVHRAQGSTINTVFLDLQDIDYARSKAEYKRLIYTGLTRASKRLVILDPTAPLN